jgi:hypothetical protein
VKSVAIDEKKVAEALRKVELSMKDIKGYEVGAIIGRDGTVIKAGIVGGEKSINPPAELIRDNIFTHTHHNGMCNLSDGDVITFIKHNGYEVRVVTSDGRFVSLKKGNGAVNTFLGEDMYKECRGKSFLDEVKRQTIKRYGKPDIGLQNIVLENMMNGWLISHAFKYGYTFTQGRHVL